MTAQCGGVAFNTSNNLLMFDAVNTIRTVETGVEFSRFLPDFDSAMRRFESSRPSQWIQWVSSSALSSFRLCFLPSFRLLTSFRSQESLAPVDKLAPLASSRYALKLGSFDVHARSIWRLMSGQGHDLGFGQSDIAEFGHSTMPAGRKRYMRWQLGLGASLLHQCLTMTYSYPRRCRLCQVALRSGG